MLLRKSNYFFLETKASLLVLARCFSFIILVREYAGWAWTATYCQPGQDRKIAAIRGHCRASMLTQFICFLKDLLPNLRAVSSAV